MIHNSCFFSSHPEMRKLDKTETLVTIGDKTYVREITKLTCIVVCVYIFSLTQFAYFLSLFELWVDFEPIPGFESRSSQSFFFFYFFCYNANSTLQTLLRFSYFITPYDAQAASAFFSALIFFSEKLSVIPITFRLVPCPTTASHDSLQ